MLLRLILFSVAFSLASDSFAQQMPGINITDEKGQTFNTSAFVLDSDKPVIIAFWATWCGPCVNELSIINDKLSDWKSIADFDFYAVSVDDSRTTKKVMPFVNGKGWDFDVLLDKNQDLKRKLNIMNVPYTIAVKKGEIIYKHAGYVAGDEEELLKIIMSNK